MAAVAVSHVYPLGSRLNERGVLEIGGCDLAEVAREFGTPAYVYAEDDMRARARAYMEAMRARTDSFEVLFAAKAFPCTAAFRVMAEEGLSCDCSEADRRRRNSHQHPSSSVYVQKKTQKDQEMIFRILLLSFLSEANVDG